MNKHKLIVFALILEMLGSPFVPLISSPSIALAQESGQADSGSEVANTAPVVDNIVPPSAGETPADSVSGDSPVTDSIVPDVVLPSEESSETPKADTPTVDSAKAKDQTSETNENKGKTTGDPVFSQENGSASNSGDLVPKAKLPDTNPITGALLYEYEFKVPKGRLGMEPSLKLSYNSQENSNVNIVGYGWDLSIPSIDRLNRKGISTMYDNNYFSSSLSGELSPMAATGRYMARVDSGDFMTYEYDSAKTSWKASDKNGVVYTFGSIVGSRFANGTKIARWYLDEMRDKNGNYVSYSYIKGNYGEVYPSEITYTNSVNGAGIYKISFVYEDRVDKVNTRKWGFDSSASKRLKTVEVRTGNVLTRKYDLGYSTGVNTVRSVLATVTETGYDKNGIATTLPPTTFDYTKGRENQVEPSGIGNGSSGAWFPYGGNTGVYYYGPAGSGVIYTDLNGDGYLDSFASGDPSCCYAGNVQDVTRNTKGSYFTVNSGGQTVPPLIFSSRNGSNITIARGASMVLDVDGDGYVDFFGMPQYMTGGSKALYLNNASSTSSGELSFTNQPSLANTYSIDGNSKLGDFEGTSNQQIFQSSSPEFAIDLDGDGIDERVGGSFDRYGNDIGVRHIDMNGDGLVDQLRGFKVTNLGDYGCFPQADVNEVNINTGVGSFKDASSSSPYFIDISQQYNGSCWSYSYRLNDYYDTNGDGIVDISNVGNKPDLLKKITYPTGGKTSVTYKASTHYRDASGKLLNPKLPLILWTVSEMKTDDGNGGTPKIDKFTYENGRLYYANQYNKKFGGFEKVTKNDGTTIEISYYHQGNGNNATYGEVGDSYAKISHAYKTDIYDLSNNLLRRTQTVYAESPITGASTVVDTATSEPTFLYVEKEITEDYDKNGNHRDHAKTYSYDSATGNLIESKDMGEVSTASTASVSSPELTDTGDDAISNRITYATDATPLFGFGKMYKPASEMVFDNLGKKIKEVRHTYDSQLFGRLTVGNETKIERWVSGESPQVFVNTTKQYNTYGLPIVVADENRNATTYSYDEYNMYPITVSNALGQITSLAYDYGVGNVSRSQEPSGYVKEVKYDPIGRILSISGSDPDGGSSLVQMTRYEYRDVASPDITEYVYTKDSSTAIRTTSYYDGLGRVVQVRKKATDTTSCTDCFVVQDTSYDDSGRVKKSSLPYFGTGWQKGSPTTDQALYTSYAYDGLGRVKEVMDVMGTQKSDYSTPWLVVNYDRMNHRKDYTKDAFGRLVLVKEYLGGVPASTEYRYDPAGNLVKLIDAQDNERNFFYDMLGRLTAAEDLHVPGDIAFGSWSYLYDAASNLASKTDPNGVTTNYGYDKLKRLTSEDNTAGMGVEVTYSYDGCSNGVGRLCSVTGTTFSKTYAYDILGRVVRETKASGQKSFATLSSYDRAGNVLNLTNPDLSVFRYDYDNSGHITSVWKKESNESSFIPVASRYEYNPIGKVSDVLYVNGVRTVNTYDATKLYRLIRKTTTSPNISTSTPVVVNASYKSITNSVGAMKKVTNVIRGFVKDLLTPDTAFAETSPDTTRRADLSAIQNALERYYDAHGTYKVANSAYYGTGIGWFSFTDALAYKYPTVASVLQTDPTIPAASRLSTSVLDDPIKRPGYLIYMCNADNNSYALFATLDAPTASESATINAAAIANDCNATYTTRSLKKNYIVRGSRLPGTPTVATPTITPASGTFTSAQQVTITTGTAGATIYYTLNGTTPTTSSSLYTFPFVVSSTVTVKAIAVKSAIISPVTTSTYSISASTSPDTTRRADLLAIQNALERYYDAHGTYKVANSAYNGTGIGWVSFTDTGVYKYPTVASVLQTDPAIPVASRLSTSVSDDPVRRPGYLIYMCNANNNSYALFATLDSPTSSESAAINSAAGANECNAAYTTRSLKKNYIVKGSRSTNPNAVVIPVISPASGTFTSAQQVTITTATAGATIYYTLDGTNPTTSSSPYSAPFTLSASATVKAIATKSGMTTSGVGSAGITITTPPVPLPIIRSFTISPADVASGNAALLAWLLEGGLPESVTITLTARNSSGTVATSTSIAVNKPVPATVETPVLTPAFGEFDTTQIIGITSSTTGAIIYYTLDGTMPTASSTLYSAPFTIATTTTVKAIATKSSMNDSAVVSGTYTRRVIVPPTPLTQIAFGPIVQDISYSYDANGNLLQLTDNSDTNAKKVVTYAYDDLSRLVSATASGSRDASKDYKEQYVYDTIGNITAKSFGVGTTSPFAIVYQYNGGSGMNYANPHAPTSVGTTTLAYDKAGNMTSDGSRVYTWDSMNRLSRVVGNGLDVAYTYDEKGDRLTVASTKDSATKSTYYPTRSYTETSSGTITRHIFAGGMLLSTLEGTGAQTKTYYDHTDMLGGQGVTTDDKGVPVEVVSYSPFGAISMDDKSSAFTESRKYIGELYDEDTGLNYLNARYYSAGRGQFLSEDPEFWKNPKDQNLMNPQSLNSYSYAYNNPINSSDPDGLSPKTYAQGALHAALYGIATAAVAVAALALLSAVTTVAVPAAAITALGIAASAVGIISTGVGGYNNYQAYSSGVISKDRFDYNNGALTVTGVTSLIGGGMSLKAASTPAIIQNAKQGALFEEMVGKTLSKEYESFTPQVLLETKSGIRTRVDFVGVKDSVVTGIEAKSSASARLTPNQKIAYPEIGKTGATVRSSGNPLFPSGYQLKPFDIRIIRPDGL